MRTVRERMELHRKNPACMSCHRMIDPIGLALENFDVTGAWRIKDNGAPIDPASTLYDGTPLASAADLQQALMKRSDVLRPHLHREPGDLRAGPAAGGERHADGARRGAPRRGRRLQVLGVRDRDRHLAGVSDEERGCAGGDHRRSAAVSTTTANQGSPRDVVHHREARSAADDAARPGRHGGAAVPGRDGAGARAVERHGDGRLAGAAAAGGDRDGARRRRLEPVGRDPAPLVAGGGGEGLRPRPDVAQPAGDLSEVPDHRQRHRRPQRRSLLAAGNRRRPLPLQRGVPDPGPPAPDRELGRARRSLARPALRPEVRPGHADSLDAAVHRERRPGRRLRLRLLVRLHRHDQLERRRDAAADDPRPADGLRPAVRGRRLGRRADLAAQGDGQRARLRDRAGGRPEPQARRQRPAADGALPGRRRARSSGGSSGSKPAMPPARRGNCRARRPACPTRSTSTSS